MEKLKVAVVGATGLAGQQFLAALVAHPWFEVAYLAASRRTAGKPYREALRDETGALQWFCQEPFPEKFGDFRVELAEELEVAKVDLVFTAIDAGPARELEPQYARQVPVISTASAFRYEEDVPIFIPAVNTDHDALLRVQQQRRGWKGFITPIPNCTTTGLAVTLKPLYDAFGLNFVVMTSLQAVSGAGRSPGVRALDILDNVLPFIPKEEEKVQTETQKILGRLEGDRIVPADFKVSCTCTRVPVLDGHTEAVFASLGRAAEVEEVKRAFEGFGGEFVALGLPSAPERMIAVHDDPFRPQPRLDRDAGGGITTTVGRIRLDDALPNGVKYLLVSHNTKMGAAKGALLVAEYLCQRGFIHPQA
ncbi:MAG TPA: aspartate-semialdehyde dehydrogenase [Armatimonadetes bacterium]|nr:aspartate-semialdehyde dehydrogenase [Armatimonadota bacterium]